MTFFCPQCNKKREVVKRLGVWSVPDVLVVHLKRFRHSSRSSNKLDTMVEFPLDQFDMGPNMARQQVEGSTDTASPPVPESQQSNITLGLKVPTTFSPWKYSGPGWLRWGGGGGD